MSRIADTEENRAKIDRVAETLQGTCLSVDDALAVEFGEGTDLTDIDSVLLERLDDAVTQCDGCGWWDESGALDDNQCCEDCRDEEESNE